MSRFLIRRLFFAVVLVLVCSSTALVLTRLAPGDIASSLGPNATREEIAAARARFDLDRSVVEQWGLWAARALKFDFGESLLYSRPVAPLIGRAAVNSALLGVVTLLVATVLGGSLGIFTAVGRRGATAIVRAISVALLSLPPLITSLLLGSVPPEPAGFRWAA